MLTRINYVSDLSFMGCESPTCSTQLHPAELPQSILCVTHIHCHSDSHMPYLQVYDLSSFIARHPGGAEQMMLGAGRDVTQLFESYHSFDIYKLVSQSWSLHFIYTSIEKVLGND